MGNLFWYDTDREGGYYVGHSSSTNVTGTKDHCHFGKWGVKHRGYCQECMGAPKVSYFGFME